jgi:hypothetical protein
MSDLTAEQFQLAVAAAIEGVENLYRQVDLLIAKLREQLAEDPEPLTLIRGTLGKSGKEDSKRVVVRYEYGALFSPATDDEEDLDDEDDEDDDPEDEDVDEAVASTSKGTRKGGRYEIVAGQPLLAVRIGMFDPRKRTSFAPEVQFAVMSDWGLGDSTSQADDRVSLQSYMLRRVTRALADRTGMPSGTRVKTSAAARSIAGASKGKSRKLTCALPAGVEAVPLYSINNAEALEKLADRIKAMWSAVNGR